MFVSKTVAVQLLLVWVWVWEFERLLLLLQKLYQVNNAMNESTNYEQGQGQHKHPQSVSETQTDAPLRYLLGLHQAAWPYLKSLSDSDAAKLIYRDHINVKHASRKRLATEIEANTKKRAIAWAGNEDGDDVADDAIADEDEKEESGDTLECLTKVLVKYLLEAGSGLGWVGFIL